MDIADKKFVLIGGAGLIGSHITDVLINEGVGEVVLFDNFRRGKKSNVESALRDPRVSIVEGDILNQEDVIEVLRDADGAFLLAALWLLECTENPQDAIQTNIVGNFNVLEAARQVKLPRLVFSSSASVYGDAKTIPMPEEHELNNRTFYGATKVGLEQMLRSYNEMHNLQYVALRYFNVYGPRQDYKNAYVSVIMKVLDKIDAGERPIIMGDGTQSYDFIYVKDIARANVLAMHSEVTDEAFNIATGIKTSINELVEMLLEITESDLKPEYKEANQTFVTDRVGDPEKAKRMLNFTPSHDLRTGLEELVAWRAEQITKDKAA